jgi:dTDP-4-dehydrorhamnose 3,5-epimerase
VPFAFEETALPGVLLVQNTRFRDARGYFQEQYRETAFARNDIATNFCQDNVSFSRCGVIRGLHFQQSPAGQAKLVSVLGGRIFDVAVDLRADSPAFLRWVGHELSEENGLSLYLPEGFAHGFAALTDAHVLYKCSSEYVADLGDGIAWNDPDLGITWPFDAPTLSDKDAQLPTLRQRGDVTALLSPRSDGRTR